MYIFFPVCGGFTLGFGEIGEAFTFSLSSFLAQWIRI